MSQTTTSAPQQQVSMPAVDLRQYVGSLVAAEGLRTSADLQVAQRAAGANMSVDVSSGACLVKDDHAAGGGFYGYTAATATNVTIATADPSNPRIDRIVVQIDDAFQGDSDNTLSIKAIAGTPTSGATLTNLSGAAAIPGSALLLANVLVGAAASSITTANVSNVALLLAMVTGSMTKLCDVTLGSSLSSIDTNTLLGGNIPQNFTNLIGILLLRTDVAAVSDLARIRFNNDSAAHYIAETMTVANTTVSAADDGAAATSANLGLVAGNTAAASIAGPIRFEIPWYAGTTWKKQVWARGGFFDALTTAHGHETEVAGFWDSAAAITRIQILPATGPNFLTSSRFQLYGQA